MAFHVCSEAGLSLNAFATCLSTSSLKFIRSSLFRLASSDAGLSSSMAVTAVNY